MEKIGLVHTIVQYLVFPGFLFLAAAGMFVSWVDRKLAARMQWRVGPPLFQPWYDLRKLLHKEILLPEGGNTLVFVLAPAVALIALSYAGASIMLTVLSPERGFAGDLFVLLYVLTIPPVCMMLGASASANPYAALGASREMKLILSYELPLLACVVVAALRAQDMSLGGMLLHQQAGWSNVYSVSGFLAAAVAAVCLQGKMGLAPFDLSEAETELAGGLFVEYAGPLLAMWKLVKMMMLVVIPLFAVCMFWGGGPLWTVILKYGAVLVAAITTRVLLPRVRIDHALRFFWTTAAPISAAALLLAVLGI